MSGANGRYDVVVAGPVTTGSSRPPTSHEPACASSSSSAASGSAGIADTVELATGARAPTRRPHGRSVPAVDRPRPRAPAHGLSLVAPDVRVFAPQPDDRAVILRADLARDRRRPARLVGPRRRGLRRVRPARPFARRLPRRAQWARRHRTSRRPGVGDALGGLRLGGRYHRLGKADARTVLRVLPMAVADFVAESFETDALRGAIAARAIHVRPRPMVGRHDRTTCSPTRPATTAGRPARRSTPAAARRPLGGARGRGPGSRGRDPDRGGGRRDHDRRRAGDRRAAHVGRGDRGAGRRRRPRPEAAS